MTEENGQQAEGEQVDLSVNATQEAPEQTPEEQAPQGPPPIADLPQELQDELNALSPEERRERHLALGPDGNPA